LIIGYWTYPLGSGSENHISKKFEKVAIAAMFGNVCTTILIRKAEMMATTAKTDKKSKNDAQSPSHWLFLPSPPASFNLGSRRLG
jgi:hypothetical protein